MPNRYRILVVDDKLPHRRFVADVLRAKGYHVEEASGSDEAFQIITTQPRFDLICLDHLMPNMRGTEIWHRLLNYNEYEKCRPYTAIFFTAYPEDIEIQQIGKGYEVLTKPLRDYHLIQTAVARALKLE